ncbi:MAG: hypothetical protein IKK37_05220 [Clostridia bacterium]|nr:hypothetical protein [Clostridia bacterium]
MEFLEYLQKRDDFTKAYPIIESFKNDIERFSALDENDFLNSSGLLVIHKKKYFLSSQLKELYLSSSGYNKVDVAFDFNKDGSIFLMCIKNKELVDAISSSKLFDEVSITYSIGKTSKGKTTNKIRFNNNNRIGAQIGYYFESDELVITDYQINYDIYDF